MLGEAIYRSSARVPGFGVGAPLVGTAPPMSAAPLQTDLFTRATAIQQFKSRGDTLLPGQSLARGEALTSKNGGVLLMQNEGNLVLYAPVGVYGLPVSDAHKGKYMSLWWSGGATPATKAVFNSDGSFYLVDDNGKQFYSANSKGAVRLILQTDGNAVWYDKNNKPVAYTVTNNWSMNPALRPKSSTGPFDTVTEGFSQFGKDVGKIPVVGDAAKIVGKVAAEPFKIAGAIASGERLDHVAIGALKDQIKIAKEVAPYAQTVVSLVPGVGSGVAAAIGAGAALAEGQNITAAIKAGIRGAIPGGALAQAGFDLAMKVASGENIGKAALETARSQLPAGAQQAFDIGLAVVTGENLQKVAIRALSNLAPAQVQELVNAGKQALSSTPGLADAYKSIASDPSLAKGFAVASGLLSHAEATASALSTVRAQLAPAEQKGFDAAVATQAPHGVASAIHTAAVTGVPPQKGPIIHEPPKKAAAEPPKKTAAPSGPIVHEPGKKSTAPSTRASRAARLAKYAPYPKMGVGVGFFNSDSKWRWFTLFANGQPIAQRGPIWLSESGAAREAESFLEATLGHDYIGTVTRWDWNGQAWHQASGNGLSAPLHHSGGHHAGRGGRRGPPRLFRGGRGVPGWWGPWDSTTEVITTTETCRTWGDPVPLPAGMQAAAKVALGASGGRPTTLRGDDGVLYLLAYENDGITARPCAAVGVGDWAQWRQAASDAWSDWSSEARDLWRNF